MRRFNVDDMSKGQRIALFLGMFAVLVAIAVLAVVSSSQGPEEPAQQVVPVGTPGGSSGSNEDPTPRFDHDEHLMADQVLTLVSALGGVDPAISKKDLLGSVSDYVSPDVLALVEKNYPANAAALKAKKYFSYVDVTSQQDVTVLSKLDANQRLIVASGDVFVSENGAEPKFLESRNWRVLFTADTSGVWKVTSVQVVVR